MQIKTVTYSRTIQPKQFESARLEMTAEVDEGDDVNDVIADLKSLVNEQLGLTKKPNLSEGLDEVAF